MWLPARGNLDSSRDQQAFYKHSALKEAAEGQRWTWPPRLALPPSSISHHLSGVSVLWLDVVGNTTLTLFKTLFKTYSNTVCVYGCQGWRGKIAYLDSAPALTQFQDRSPAHWRKPLCCACFRLSPFVSVSRSV